MANPIKASDLYKDDGAILELHLFFDFCEHSNMSIEMFAFVDIC